MKNDSLKREAAFLYVKRQMREEMDLAWKDFFEKNPDNREEDIWRRIEERLLAKGSIATEEIVTSVKPIVPEKGVSANGSTEANALRKREKIAPLILKRRIWWEPAPGAGGYVVYLSKDRTIFEPDHFSWDRTPGIILKLAIEKTEVVIPDEWPDFPTEPGTYYIGITSRDDIGNQSAPLLLSGLFKFLPPSAPSRGGIEYL